MAGDNADIKSDAVATGPAGPVPHLDYCTHQCYERGKKENSKSCECKGCDGDAHGQGKKYAFENGYLKYSPLGSRKPKKGQEAFPFLNKDDDVAEEIISDRPSDN